MLDLDDVVQGSQYDTILTAINRSVMVRSPGGFLSTDVLTSIVWQGQEQATLFTPTVSWNTVATGYFNFGMTPAQTAGLDYAGEYHAQVWCARAGVNVCIADFLISILPTAGTYTQVVTPYCTLRDMLEHAPWITMVQDDTADQEAFYTQRLEAKQWLDWLIVRSWRGTSAAYFGDPGRSAQYWLGGWARRSALPSQWLINQLSGGIVIQPLTLTAQGHGYTYANVTFSGGGPDATQASAYAIVSGGQVISVLAIQSGYGYTSTPTITITGDGTGATATCTIAANVLMIRPQTRRICALKAASIVGLGQIGRLHNIANMGAHVSRHGYERGDRDGG